jgi:hypothetical protein
MRLGHVLWLLACATDVIVEPTATERPALSPPPDLVRGYDAGEIFFSTV